MRGASIVSVENTIFSDTILLWADATSTGWDNLARACAVLIAYAVDGGWPLRGGIACGQAVLDISTRCFVGQPIVEAYNAEQSQEWIGAGIHGSVGAHPVLGQGALAHDDVIEYTVPVKRGKPPILHAIHWGPYSSQASSQITGLVQAAPTCRARRKYGATRKYLRTRCAGTHAMS